MKFHVNAIILVTFLIRNVKANPTDIILSEFLPNPDGDDIAEFIELFNPTQSSINLTGYSVCDPVKCTALSGSLASGEYLVICKDLAQYATCDIETTIALNNSGGDTIYLYDASSVLLEQVSYSTAPSGQSYVRDGSTVSTFTTTTTITPGTGSLAVNGGTPSPTPSPTTSPPTTPPPTTPAPTFSPVPPCTNHVIISQVLYDEPSGTTNEWVELYNPTDSNLDLSGWKLVKTTTSSTEFIIPSGNTIASGGRFILGKSGFFSQHGFHPDIEFTLALTNSGMTLTLKDPSGVNIDEVAWKITGWTSLATADGGSIIRLDASDSGNDESDWEVLSTPLAGGRFYSCSAIGGGVGNGCWGDHLLFGKIHYDATNAGEEWIEIFNPTKNTIDLAGYQIQDNAGTYVIAAGTISSLGRFIIAQSGFQAKYGLSADVTDFSLSLNDSGDQLYLKDPSNSEIDFVAWEGGASGCTVCTGWDIMAGDGQYLVRATPVDTDGPDDWVRVSSGIVPGEGRPTCGTPSCVYPDSLTITAIDIGQGDMSLVATQSKFLVGDTGESNWNTAYDADAFDAWFRNRHGERCTNLDYVVISHFQVDHIGYIGYGGLWKIHNKFKYNIGKTLFRDFRSYVGSRSGTYDDWVSYLDTQGGFASLNAEIATVGASQINLGHGTSTKIVHVDGKTPLTPGGCRPEILSYFDVNAVNPPSENDYSVAFVVSLGDFDMFIGGDVSGQDYVGGFNYEYHDTETCLANDVQEVDIYRVNHHGSDHSSNVAFLSAMQPQVAVISVGDTNPYGHPRQVVMDRLNGPTPVVGNVSVYMTQRGDTTVDVYNAKVVSHVDITVAADGSTFTVSGTGVTGDVYTSRNYGGPAPTPAPLPSECTPPPASCTRIEEIQGTVDVSPMRFQTNVNACPAFVTTVISNGFYMQHPDRLCTIASSGIFVYTGTTPTVVEGDYVSVTGSIEEYNQQTQMESPTIQMESPGGATFPVDETLTLPVASVDELEAMEGMLVSAQASSGKITIAELYNLDRYGVFTACQASLTEGRVFQYTQSNIPDIDGYASHVSSLPLKCLMVDDNNAVQNPDPLIAGGAYVVDNTTPFRAGNEVTLLRGPLYQSFTDPYYKIYTLDSNDLIVDFTDNPRPSAPSLVSGTFTITSTNLLNFFTTFGLRGADDQTEYDRQKEKLLTALSQLNTDVFGIIELENNDVTANTLISELNTKTGKTYASASVATSETSGTDDIRTDIFYDTNIFTLEGTATLDDSDAAASTLLSSSTINSIFNDANTNRVPIAATLKHTATGKSFTVVSVHLKSKGGSGTGLDADIEDGKGNWNNQRLLGIQAINSWLAGNPTGASSTATILVGDFNSYAMEDPIVEVQNLGYTSAEPLAPPAYSYVFDGQWGTLDYIFTKGLLTVEDVMTWHVNSDESDYFDYNTNFRGSPPQNEFDGTTPYRYSDHDPLVASITLN